MGEGQLVYVQGRGALLLAFVEEYHRYRLEDIQSLVVAKTSNLPGTILYLAVCLVFGLPLALILTLVQPLSPIAVGFAIACGLGLLGGLALLVRHWLLGPLCLCELYTQQSRILLRPLRRYRSTMKIATEIDALCREAQSEGNWETEENSTSARDTSPPSVSSHFSKSAFSYVIPRLVLPTMITFALVGFVGIAALLLENSAVVVLVISLLAVASILQSFALVLVLRKPTPDPIRRVIWTLLSEYLLLVIFGSIYYFVAAIQEPAYTVGFSGPIEAFLSMADVGGLSTWGGFLIVFAVQFFTGLWGVALVHKWKQQLARANVVQSSHRSDATSS